MGVRQALNMYDSALETSGLGKKQAPLKEAFQGGAASAAARMEAARAMHQVLQPQDLLTCSPAESRGPSMTACKRRQLQLIS